MSFHRRALLQGGAAALATQALPAEAQTPEAAANRLPRGIHAAAPANAAGARMLKVDAPVRCAAGNKPLNPVIDTGR